MSELTRRGLIVAAGAAGAGLTLGSPASAGAPAAGKQVPSFYRSKLGDFELTVASDGARPIPLPPRFVLNVPNEEVLKAAEAAYTQAEASGDLFQILAPDGTVVRPDLLPSAETRLHLYRQMRRARARRPLRCQRRRMGHASGDQRGGCMAGAG